MFSTVSGLLGAIDRRVFLRISCESPEQCQRIAEVMKDPVEPTMLGLVVLAVTFAVLHTMWRIRRE